jgi:hypothetical protein
MAAHVLPRLTLKAGSPRGGRADRRNTPKSKFAKAQISKIANRKRPNFENFHYNFSRDRSRNCSLQDRLFVSEIKSNAFASSLPGVLCSIHNVGGCIFNASKQCPYEATTSTRLNSHGSEERTQEHNEPNAAKPQLVVEI